jgi:hypothetical protein
VPLLLHNVTYDRVRNEDRPLPPPMVELVPTLVAELGVGQRTLGFDDPDTQRVVLIAAVVVLPTLAIVGAVGARDRRRDVMLLLVAVVVLPLVVYVGSGRRLVAVRFFVPFMTAYAALIGLGLARLKGYRAVAAGVGVVALCAVPLIHFITRFDWSYDHRRVADAMQAQAEPGDVVLVVHPFEALYYRRYLPDMPIRGLTFTPLTEQNDYVIKPEPMQFDTARARVAPLVGDAARFWVIGQSPRSFASDAAEEARLLSWLSEHYDAVASLDHVTGGDPRIVLFRTRPNRGTDGGR